MGIWAAIKRMFSIRLNKLVKSSTTNIEVLEYELGESKTRIDKLGDKLSSLRADRKVAISTRDEITTKNAKLQAILDTAVRQDDEGLGNEAINLIEKNATKIEVHGKNIEYLNSVIEKLEEQYDSLKTKFDEKQLTFEKLKMQAEFAKNMKSINEEIKKNYSGDDFDFSGIEAIEKEIEKSVHFETDRNERIGSDSSIESKLDKATAVNKFEEYKRQLAAKQGE